MKGKNWVEMDGTDADVLPEQGERVEIKIEYYTARGVPPVDTVVKLARHDAGIFHIAKSGSPKYPLHRTVAWRKLHAE